MPSVETYMTPALLKMSAGKPVRLANELMTSAGIRHLPVVDESGNVIGIVSDREINVGLLFPGPGELLLKDLIASEPYIVRATTPIDEVVFEMMEHKYGCALVEDEGGKAIGIFTEVDALRAFHELLGDIYTGRLPVTACPP